MSVYTKLACFAGGALFGSFGVKLLSSKDAKKAYVHVTAAGLRMKHRGFNLQKAAGSQVFSDFLDNQTSFSESFSDFFVHD